MNKDLKTKWFSHMISGRISGEYLLWMNRKRLLGTLLDILKIWILVRVFNSKYRFEHWSQIVKTCFHFSYNLIKKFKSCIPTYPNIFTQKSFAERFGWVFRHCRHIFVTGEHIKNIQTFWQSKLKLLYYEKIDFIGFF